MDDLSFLQCISVISAWGIKTKGISSMEITVKFRLKYLTLLGAPIDHNALTFVYSLINTKLLIRALLI